MTRALPQFCVMQNRIGFTLTPMTYREFDPSEKSRKQGYKVTNTQGKIFWIDRETALKYYKPRYYSMSFAEVLVEIKDGKRFSRNGWNGKGLTISYVPECKKDGTTYTEHFLLHNAERKTSSVWVPSTSDIFAKDWHLD